MWPEKALIRKIDAGIRDSVRITDICRGYINWSKEFPIPSLFLAFIASRSAAAEAIKRIESNAGKKLFLIYGLQLFRMVGGSNFKIGLTWPVSRLFCLSLGQIVKRRDCSLLLYCFCRVRSSFQGQFEESQRGPRFVESLPVIIWANLVAEKTLEKVAHSF